MSAAAPTGGHPTQGLVLRQMLRERRRSLLWWSVGMGLVIALIVASFPSVANSAAALDEYVKELPDGLADVFGLSGASITSPEGYLTSQLYSNLYTIVLLVLGIGAGAWSVAGSEGDHTLEMVLANPVSRPRVAVERFVGVALVLAVVTVVSTALLHVLAPTVDLDEGLAWWSLWSAGLGAFMMALLHAAVAFAVGAAGSGKGVAVAVASAVAVAGFLGYALSGLADALAWMDDVSPWAWFLQAQPMSDPDLWSMVGLPGVVTGVVVALGVWAFDRRDVG